VADWKKIGEEAVYEGWRGIIQKKFELPDGQTSTYDIVQNGNFVTIAAFTENKEAILVRQFRPGPEIDLVSFPEGYIDPNENPLQTAQRELLEETGYQAGEMIYQKTFYRAYSTEVRTCVLAIDCKKITNQSLDEQEFIEVFTMPLASFKKFITDPNDDSFTSVDSAYLALKHLGWL